MFLYLFNVDLCESFIQALINMAVCCCCSGLLQFVVVLSFFNYEQQAGLHLVDQSEQNNARHMRNLDCVLR